MLAPILHTVRNKKTNEQNKQKSIDAPFATVLRFHVAKPLRGRTVPKRVSLQTVGGGH